MAISERSSNASMGRQKRYQKAALVRLTDDEYRQLTERAKQSHVSLSRLLVESTLAGKALTSEEKERTDKLINQRDWAITQVVRVGNNLNQIARQLNSQRGSISTRIIEQVLIATYEALCDLRQRLEHGGANR
jgi:DNA-binding NarL/FixJ family response regulator